MTEFKKAIHIVEVLQGLGFEAYFVGGCVRDDLLGLESDDIDIVTSAQSHEVQKAFPECKAEIGSLFLVNIVDGIEVATYRHDNDENGLPLFAECYSEDSSRRDLTINSIAYDPIADLYIDFWNGQDDLKNRIIRFVGIAQSRIEEDPVRMLRACRFAAKIDGRLIPSAFLAIKDNAYLIDSVPRERIQKEIFKALLTDKPSIFWNLLQRTGILKRIIPELDDCWWHDGGNHHTEYVHEHLLACGDAIDKSNPIVRLAGYLHDIGKVEAYNEQDFTFINHDKFGTDLVRDILSNLRFSSSIIEKVCSLTLVHMRCLDIDATPKSYRKTIAKLQKHGLEVSDFLVLKIADRHANARRDDYSQEDINLFINNFKDAYNVENAAFSVRDLAVSGKDVIESGTPQGKLVGLVLDHIFDSVVENPEFNERETLLKWLNDTEYWYGWFVDLDGPALV